MQVYLLRHGIAEDRRPGRSDAERKLTEEGKEKLRRVLIQAKEAVGSPALILTSPLIRAVETAEIAAEVLGYRGTIPRTEALLPSSTPLAVWKTLRDNAAAKAILMAGHEPLLSETAGYLLGVPRAAVDFRKGALMRIDVDDLTGTPRGVLEWLLTPRLAGHCG
ncbi:MAG TPA: histidine phosphatase family protein [Bryobacteraceae bacterium]|nr:histidine phosphatase family protein [Bryobacteraceae bacterium]